MATQSRDPSRFKQKCDPLVSNRRRAIQALGRFDDPRVKEALRELVGKA